MYTGDNVLLLLVLLTCCCLLCLSPPQVDPDDGGGIDWTSEVDRILVMKIIIKMADINTPTKSYDLHRSWTKRITEEFYQQAEQETGLGLAPTIFMDRKHPEKLPAIQLSFIQHLVSPLFHAAAEAAIIPGILEELESGATTPPSSHPALLSEPAEGKNTSGTESDADSQTPAQTPAETAPAAAAAATAAAKEELLDYDIEDDAFALQEKEQPAKKFISVILNNLRINYEVGGAMTSQNSLVMSCMNNACLNSASPCSDNCVCVYVCMCVCVCAAGMGV